MHDPRTVDVLQLRGQLDLGKTEWDDATTITVTDADGGIAGHMVCGRQYGDDDPLVFADASWVGGRLVVARIANSMVSKGSLVAGPDDDDPSRFTGEVQLDDRYQGALTLSFTGRRAG